MLRRLFKIFGSLIILSVMIVLTYYVSTNRLISTVNGYSIEIVDSLNNRFIGKKDIEKLLVKKIPFKLKLLSKLDRGNIEKFLDSQPSIERSEVYFLVDGRVKIKVWQREPVYRVIGKSNYYIDSRRQIMPLSKNYTKRVLIVSGHVSKRYARLQLFDFCKYLSNHEFWSKYIGQIHVKANQEIILVPLVDSFKIVLGNLDQYYKKLNKFEAFIENARENKIWGKYKFINLKYNKQIVCIK